MKKRKILNLIRKRMKRIMAIVLVFVLVFNANVLDAIRIVYADVEETIKSEVDGTNGAEEGAIGGEASNFGVVENDDECVEEEKANAEEKEEIPLDVVDKLHKINGNDDIEEDKKKVDDTEEEQVENEEDFEEREFEDEPEEDNIVEDEEEENASDNQSIENESLEENADSKDIEVKNKNVSVNDSEKREFEEEPKEDNAVENEDVEEKDLNTTDNATEREENISNEDEEEQDLNASDDKTTSNENLEESIENEDVEEKDLNTTDNAAEREEKEENISNEDEEDIESQENIEVNKEETALDAMVEGNVEEEKSSDEKDIEPTADVESEKDLVDLNMYEDEINNADRDESKSFEEVEKELVDLDMYINEETTKDNANIENEVGSELGRATNEEGTKDNKNIENEVSSKSIENTNEETTKDNANIENEIGIDLGSATSEESANGKVENEDVVISDDKKENKSTENTEKEIVDLENKESVDSDLISEDGNLSKNVMSNKKLLSSAGTENVNIASDSEVDEEVIGDIENKKILKSDSTTVYGLNIWSGSWISGPGMGTFNCSFTGSTAYSGKVTLTYSGGIGIPFQSLTKKFTGWNTNFNISVNVTTEDGNTHLSHSDINLITDMNDGSCSKDGPSMDYGAPVINFKVDIESQTITPIWADAPKYLLTLDGGIGTVTTTKYYAVQSNQNYYTNEAVTAKVTSLEVPVESTGKYKFTGYWTARTGSDGEGTGTQITDETGAFLQTADFFTTDTPIYAGWEKVIHEITLDDTTGSGGDGKVYEWYGDGIYGPTDATCSGSPISSVTVPTKTGYVFLGYYDDPVAKTKKYINEDGSINSSVFTNTAFTADDTIYAVFEVDKKKVTLDLNSGSGSLTEIWIKSGEVYTVEACDASSKISALTGTQIPTRANYKFGGFEETVLGVTTKYITKEGSFSLPSGGLDSDKTWVAKWMPIYEITLNKNGALTQGTEKVYVVYDTVEGGVYSDSICNSVITSITNPTKIGHIFLGYYEEVATPIQRIDNTGNILFGGDVFNSAKELKAHFEEEKYNIVLNNDGADVDAGTGSLNVKYNVGIYGEGDTSCTGAIVSSITVPLKSHYVFDGYYDEVNTTKQYIKADGTFNTSNFTSTTFTSSIEMKAHWIKVYTITLNPNGGAGGVPTEVYVKEGVGIYKEELCTNLFTGIDSIPTKTGYIFKGYVKEEASGMGSGETYINEDKSKNANFTQDKFTANTPIYAKWEPKVIEITLSNEGADLIQGTNKIYVKYNEGFYSDISCATSISSITIPKKTGHSFDGYYDTISPLGVKYIESDGTINTSLKTAFSDNKTFKANYVEGIYKITLNNMGATSSGTNHIYEKYNNGIYGESDSTCSGAQISSITVPTKTNFIFDGYWDSDTTPTKKYINANGNINTAMFTNTAFSDNAEIKAKWIPVYEIGFDNNGGVGVAPDKVYVEKGVGIFNTIDCNTAFSGSLTTKPTRAGYKYKGFYENANGTGKEYIKEDGTINTTNFTKDSFTGNTDIHAKWENNVYKIDLNDDGATSSGLGNLYVKYDVGIYENPSCSGSGITSISVKPTKTHFMFGGYYDVTNPSVEYVDKDGNINTTNFTNTTWSYDDTTITIPMKAKWLPVHKITLDKNGGDTECNPQYIWIAEGAGIYNEEECITPFTIINTPPTRINYGFKGFSSDGTSAGIIYINDDGTINPSTLNGGTFTLDAEIYAIWGPAIYKLTLFNDGATSSGTDHIYEKYNDGIYGEGDSTCSGAQVSSITVPTKTGYKFRGYYDQLTMSKKYINEDGTFNTVEFTNTTFIMATTLQAKWENNVYTVNFDTDGASAIGSSHIYVKYDDGIYKDLPCANLLDKIDRPTKEGFAFGGYYDIVDTTKEYIKPDGTVNTTNFITTLWNYDDTSIPIEMKAHWIKVYEIKLEKNGGITSSNPSKIYLEEGVGIFKDKNCYTEFTQLTTLPTRPNYGFRGFVELPDGTGVEYIKADGTINSATLNGTTFTANTEIFAKWGPAIYKITLNKNGGTTQGTTELYEQYNVGIYGQGDASCEGMQVSNITIPTRTGYAFKGYFDELDKQYIKEDGTFNTTNFTKTTFTSHKTLKAKWEEKVFEITLHINGGDNVGTEKIYEKYNVGLFEEANCINEIEKIVKPTKGNLVCNGFYQNANGTGIRYINEDGTINTTTFTKTTFCENKTIYATYTEKYKITLDFAGGTGTVEELYKEKGGSVYIDEKCREVATQIARPTRNKYTFKGYFKEKNGQGEKHIDNLGNVIGSVFIDSEKTIYAYWVYNSSGTGGGGGGGTHNGTIPAVNKLTEEIIKPSKYEDTTLIRRWEEGKLKEDYMIAKDVETNSYKYTADDTLVKNNWVGEIGMNNRTIWHYLDENSKEVTGWNNINDSWYYFDDRGVMSTGYYEINDTTFYFIETQNSDEGKLLSSKKIDPNSQNITLLNGNIYEWSNNYKDIVRTQAIKYDKGKQKFVYTSDNSLIREKWVGYNYNNDIKWQYINMNAEPYIGWMNYNDKWYMFDQDGNMMTGRVVFPGNVVADFESTKGTNEGMLLNITYQEGEFVGPKMEQMNMQLLKNNELIQLDQPQAQLQPQIQPQPQQLIQISKDEVYEWNDTHTDIVNSKNIKYDETKNKFVYVNDQSLVKERWVGYNNNGKLKWKYIDKETNPYIGWMNYNDKWYMFGENGDMMTGRVEFPGNIVAFFEEEGKSQGMLLKMEEGA